MTRCKLALLVPLLLALPLAAFVGPPAPVPELADLIPADSTNVVGLRDWSALCDRLERLATSMGKPGRGKKLEELTWLANQIYGLDITRGRFWTGQMGTSTVASRTYTDFDGVATDLGFDRGRLKLGKTAERESKAGFVRWCLALPDQVLLSGESETLNAVMKSKRLSRVISPNYRKAMNEADVAVHFNLLTPDGKKIFGDRVVSIDAQDAEEQQVGRQIEALSKSGRWLLGTARVDQGLALRLRTDFVKDMKPDALALIKSLQSDRGPSNLSGLPEGRVVAAHATSADGAASAVPVWLLVRALREDGMLANVLQAADHPLANGEFSALWRRFKGRRLAVYHNADEAKHGLFSLVAILDTDDPKRAVDEIADLARFARGKDLDLSDPAGKGDDAAAVRKLVADLDSDDYPTREAASAKLLLIGDPALPFLTKASESTSPEQRRRARRIVEMLEAKRKAAVAGGTARVVQPGFVLQRAAETVGGQKVDVVSVRLGKGDADADADAVAVLRKMAGPDWAKVRLATVGKKIVLLVGSDVGLLEQALRNVKARAAGLEASPLLERFRRHADRSRQFEAHVALEAVEALTPEGIDPKKLKAGALSSLAVALDRERFEADAWITPAALKAILQKLDWWKFI